MDADGRAIEHWDTLAMGKKKKGRQDTMWVATSDLPKSPGHPFYQRLNRVLAANCVFRTIVNTDSGRT